MKFKDLKIGDIFRIKHGYHTEVIEIIDRKVNEVKGD